MVSLSSFDVAQDDPEALEASNHSSSAFKRRIFHTSNAARPWVPNAAAEFGWGRDASAANDVHLILPLAF